MSRFLFSRRTITSDVSAGITLGIESIPDGMANGLLAAVNPIHGVYAYMVGVFTGAWFTSSVYMNVSTTSALSVAAGDALVSIPTAQKTAALVILVLLMGLFRESP